MNTLQAMTMALVLAQSPGTSQSTATEEVRLDRGIVTLIEHVQIPARQAGVLKALVLEDGTPVREGQSVKKGETLGTLDDQDARARVRAAETEQKVAVAEQRKAEAGIEAAVATVKVAGAEVFESQDIAKRSPGSIPPTQIRRQILTEERARSEAEVARHDLETATLTIDAKQAQMDVASITLEQHKIAAPQDGVIVQLYRHVGEWVSPGDPIMRLIHMDKLRVEGFVDASSYTPDEIYGSQVEVLIHLPHGRTEKFNSTISYVSPIVEASGEYRVWCDVVNRQHKGHWVLRPGLYAEMTIRLNSAPTNVAAAR